MHAELQAVVDEFDTARRRLHALADRTPADSWARRPSPDRWSIGECVTHLNLTSRAYLPLLDDGLARAARLGRPTGRRFRRDPIGWLLWKMSGPPVRVRTKTTPAFVPGGDIPKGQLIAEFDRLQAEQVARVRAADGAPIDRVRITSPFDARVKYNLYACFTILPRHQHRHLWQAEQIWLEVGKGPTAVSSGNVF